MSFTEESSRVGESLRCDSEGADDIEADFGFDLGTFSPNPLPEAESDDDHDK